MFRVGAQDREYKHPGLGPSYWISKTAVGCELLYFHLDPARSFSVFYHPDCDPILTRRQQRTKVKVWSRETS